MPPLVLIVEDDPDLRDTLAEQFAAAGVDTLAAPNGAAAIELVAGQPQRPSVIILDMMMPVMDGPTFLGRQASVEALADVPIIITTAGFLPARTGTVRAVLAKPVQFSVLLPLVRNICGLAPH